MSNKRGMSTATAHWLRTQTHEPPKLMEIHRNGNRLSSARIIRPASELRYLVTGQDALMNDVSRVEESMDAALDVATGMLYARIKPLVN